MAEQKRFAGLATRSQLRAANNLGVVFNGGASKQKFRNRDLDLYDQYYEARQYVGLHPWDVVSTDGTHIPIRERKPRLQLNFAKVLTSRLASKLVGRSTFPDLKIEDDPETEEYLRIVRQSSYLRAALTEPVRRMLNSGSVLVRFSIVNGAWKIDHYLSKWCYPEFDATKNLEFVKIQYIFDDENDLDEKKNPKKKWYRMDLGKDADILYDNPEYNQNEEEPKFSVVAKADHKLGFVQAEFMVTASQPNKIDGPSLISDVLGFIDELNYSISQSSTAVQYNQDPQLLLKGMDDEEMTALIRSSMKAWALGKEGEASFLEAGMKGVEAAEALRTSVKVNIQDIARVVFLDPEKIVGSAQSGKAMEVLHGPMVELIEELRPQLEKHIIALTLKMALTNLQVAQRGGLVPVIVPPGYQPKSLGVTVSWPDIFPATMEDLQKKVSIAVQVANASLVSRETMAKWLAKEFGIENIEEEMAKVAAQPVINPFGGF